MHHTSGNLETLEKPQVRSTTAELFEFLVHNKKWWLLPVVGVLGLLGTLLLLSGTAAAPFIYTLF
jgi:hypothetical protein